MDIIVLKDRTYDTIASRTCFVVNEYLGVVPLEAGYKIYKIQQGKPFIGTLFVSKEDAIKAAEIFFDFYKEYFPIWDNDEWKNANIPLICQWSVKNGINLYKFVQDTETHGKPIRCASLISRINA